RESELFRAVFGGYGGLGVVTEVELDLDTNDRMERIVRDVPLDDYPGFFRSTVLADASVLMHNADLSPPNFDRPRSVSWIMTNKPVPEPGRLTPRGLDYSLERNAIWAISEIPGKAALRELADRKLLGKPMIVWRNHEASLDTASLEPRTRRSSTYLLQEFFV